MLLPEEVELFDCFLHAGAVHTQKIVLCVGLELLLHLFDVVEA